MVGSKGDENNQGLGLLDGDIVGDDTVLQTVKGVLEGNVVARAVVNADNNGKNCQCTALKHMHPLGHHL